MGGAKRGPEGGCAGLGGLTVTLTTMAFVLSFLISRTVIVLYTTLSRYGGENFVVRYVIPFIPGMFCLKFMTYKTYKAGVLPFNLHF